MSLNIIDSNNPLVLLKSYEIKEKSVRNVKITGKGTSYDENINIWLMHLNTIFKDSVNNSVLKDVESFINITSNSDIIHSTVGLFDTCLPDMDLDTIYNSIVDKNAYTILAFSSLSNALHRVKKYIGNIKKKADKIEHIQTFLKKDKFNITTQEENDDVYSTGEDKEDDFNLIFNDEESIVAASDTSSSGENESDQDFSLGYNKYIKSIYQRKLSHLTEKVDQTTQIGFENQIVGAISFKIRYVDVRRVVHITMLGVLKEYRSRGLGKYLINLVLDQKIVGKYDAVVVHADYSACGFFKKNGFSDDTLLNTQWYSLEPEYTNCSLLTYVSAYSSKLRENHLLAEEFSTAEMEVDIKLWQKRVTEVHCFQFQVFQKMKMEIEYLKETIKSQDKVMKTLMKELRESNKEKVRLERYLKTNIKDSNEDCCVKNTIKENLKSDEESYSLDNIELIVKDHFLESLKMVGQNEFIKYQGFSPADIPPLLIAEYKAIKTSLLALSPRLTTKSIVPSRILYFCESFSMTEDSKFKILAEGFDKNNRKPGSQGLGYYFASNPATAAVYSGTNSLIVTEVILGNICRNISEVQPLKESAPEGYESVLIASSYSNQTNNNAVINECDRSFFYSQEFVIFDPAQALPLGLVNYSMVD